MIFAENSYTAASAKKIDAKQISSQSLQFLFLTRKRAKSARSSEV